MRRLRTKTVYINPQDKASAPSVSRRDIIQQPEASASSEALKVAETIESCGLQKALDIKLLKHKKYLEVLQEFLREKYEFSPCCFLTITDITNDYNEFIKNNDKIKNFCGLFGLVLKDIPLIDNRYCQKDIEFCNNCNSKYFKNCCEAYKTKKEGRAGCCYRRRCIMNIKRQPQGDSRREA